MSSGRRYSRFLSNFCPFGLNFFINQTEASSRLNNKLKFRFPVEPLLFSKLGEKVFLEQKEVIVGHNASLRAGSAIRQYEYTPETPIQCTPIRAR